MDKRERQRQSAQMPKCGCGNIARPGAARCGRCESENDEILEKNQLLQKAYGANTVDKLHEVVAKLAERVLK